MKNTCSIKLLKKAYIGLRVRMTGDSTTETFENVPMTGMKIEDYNKQGFFISHPALPKKVWVDFEQLPLTRLKIENGIIADEITFVENIVNHQMQLIRTLDTEYIDLIYAEKQLQSKADLIIPISEAIPGNIYVGAQCEEGNEMIFLGTWFTKKVSRDKNRRYYRQTPSKFYISKLSPPRAYFLIPSNDLSYKEELEINKSFGLDEYRPNDYYKWNDSQQLDYDQKQKACSKAKAEFLKNSNLKRYRIKDFAITSKIIKNLIKTNKSDIYFGDKNFNKSFIIPEINFRDGNWYNESEIKIEFKNPPKFFDFVLTNTRYYSDAVQFLSDTKENIDIDAREFIENNFPLKLEDIFFEDSYR